MKKRFLNLILILGVILSMLPIYTRADSYSEAENIVKNYLEKNEFKNSYNKYLYTNGANNLSGMISKKEFEMTRYDKNKTYQNISFSYLWNSKPFWSSTVENNKNIPIRDNYEILPNDDELVGTRVTQYINNTTGVYGTGTYSDPWLFAPQYKVRIKVNDTSKGYITDSSYASVEDEVELIYTQEVEFNIFMLNLWVLINI